MISFPVLVLVFSLVVLGLAVFVNIELSSAANISPLRMIYATLLTLVGVLGVMIGAALMMLHKRIARLEEKGKHNTEETP
jgi:hypothetical protein